MQEMYAQNPVLAQIAAGGDLKGKFYAMCKQRGVDPEDVLNDIRR